MRTVLDALAALGAESCGGDPASDAPSGTRARARAAALDRGRSLRRATGPSSPAQDVAFQRRRQAFLHDRLNDLLRGADRAVRMVAAANLFAIEGAPKLAGARDILDTTRDPDVTADGRRGRITDDPDAGRPAAPAEGGAQRGGGRHSARGPCA